MEIQLRCTEGTGKHKKRQAEGIVAAKARGTHFGRPVKVVPPDFSQIINAWESGEITFSEAIERCGDMRPSTFYRRLREFRLVNSEDKQLSNPSGVFDSSVHIGTVVRLLCGEGHILSIVRLLCGKIQLIDSSQAAV